MVWPWWSLPFFALLFYARFRKQIMKEEKDLEKLAGKKYTNYCKRVPRIFPTLRRLAKVKIKEVINLKEAFSTKEKRGLWGWPLLAFLLESFQEELVFQETIPSHTFMIFLMATIFFAIGYLVYSQKK
jgi:hypothetical protein